MHEDLNTYTVHPPTDAALVSRQAIRLFPAAQTDVLSNNGKLQLSRHVGALHFHSTRSKHTLSAWERNEMTKTDAWAAFIIFQYAACVTRPSSRYAVSMFLTAWNRKESRCWIHAILHLLRQRHEPEWSGNLTECWMISLEQSDEGLSRLKSHVYNLAGLIKAATCGILTSINLSHVHFGDIRVITVNK